MLITGIDTALGKDKCAIVIMENGKIIEIRTYSEENFMKNFPSVKPPMPPAMKGKRKMPKKK